MVSGDRKDTGARTEGGPPTRSLYGSFIVTSVLAAIVVSATLCLAIASKTQLDWVQHTLDATNHIGRVRSLTQSAESGGRGYLLTRDETYLDPYRRALKNVRAALDELGALIADNPQQQQATTRLEQLVQADLKELGAAIEAFSSGRDAEALTIFRRDRGLMAIGQLLNAMEETERQLLVERRSRADVLDHGLKAGGIVVFVLLCVAGALGLYISRRAFLEMVHARDKLRDLNRDLMRVTGRSNDFHDNRLEQGGSGGGFPDLSDALRVFDEATRNLIDHQRSAREEELRTHRAHDAALAGIWEWRLKDNRNYWGASVWALYGLQPDANEPSFDTWVSAIHPDDRERSVETVRSAAAAAHDFEIQWRVNTPDGTPERWLLSRGRPYIDEKGVVERYVGIVIDISDRRRAEDALRRSERRMAAILGALPIGVALVDTRGRTIIANEFYRRLVPGFVPSRDQDRLHLWQACDDKGRPLNPEEYPAAKAMRGERVWPGQVFLYHGDNQRGPFWTQVAAIPLISDEGGIAGATVVITDIDETRRAEEALRASEEEFRAFFETAAVGTVELGLDGRFYKTNARFREIAGYSAEQLVSLTPYDITHPEDRPRDRELLDAFLAGKRPTYANVKRFVRQDGSLVWVEVAAAMVRDGAGKPLRTAGIVQDITERRKTEDALRASDARLVHASRLSEMGHLAAALAHELNQPLSAVASYMGGGRRILSSDNLDADQKRKLVGMMEQAAAQALRAGEIIRRMRELVRSGESEKTIENAAAVLSDAAYLASVAAKHSGVCIEQDFAECGEVLVDKIQIQQVMLNLVRNAIEAMANSPRKLLRLKLVPQVGEIEMSVSDTGPGLTAPARDRLFSPFSGTKDSGMGIGLSVCREIIESHGGRISVGENADGGTVFRFTLPSVRNDDAG